VVAQIVVRLEGNRIAQRASSLQQFHTGINGLGSIGCEAGMVRGAVYVGDELFPSTKALRQRYEDNYQCLNEDKTVSDDDDDAFLLALVALHGEVHREIGSGIDHFEVDRHPVWNDHGFWIVRTEEVLAHSPSS
jgi:hypothetical protein